MSDGLILLKYLMHIFSECSKHCSLCYNETECYECTQGFFLSETGECEREYNKMVKHENIHIKKIWQELQIFPFYIMYYMIFTGASLQ